MHVACPFTCVFVYPDTMQEADVGFKTSCHGTQCAVKGLKASAQGMPDW